MAAALSPEEQILALHRALAERDATIAALTTGLAAEQAAHEARRAETVIVKARLTTVLLEIEHMKMQLASLRRQRYGQSSEKLDRDIAQLEMRLEDLEETAGEQIAATPKLPELEPEAGSQTAKPQRKPFGRKPLPEHLPREIAAYESGILVVHGWAVSIGLDDVRAYVPDFGRNAMADVARGFFFHDGNFVISHKGAKLTLTAAEGTAIVKFLSEHYGLE